MACTMGPGWQVMKALRTTPVAWLVPTAKDQCLLAQSENSSPKNPACVCFSGHLFSFTHFSALHVFSHLGHCSLACRTTRSGFIVIPLALYRTTVMRGHLSLVNVRSYEDLIERVLRFFFFVSCVCLLLFSARASHPQVVAQVSRCSHFLAWRPRACFVRAHLQNKYLKRLVLPF